MMWIAKCKIDNRGRLTLPKSFMEANKLNMYTDVYIQTMYNTENCVKLVFKDNLIEELENVFDERFKDNREQPEVSEEER